MMRHAMGPPMIVRARPARNAPTSRLQPNTTRPSRPSPAPLPLATGLSPACSNRQASAGQTAGATWRHCPSASPAGSVMTWTGGLTSNGTFQSVFALLKRQSGWAAMSRRLRRSTRRIRCWTDCARRTVGRSNVPPILPQTCRRQKHFRQPQTACPKITLPSCSRLPRTSRHWRKRRRALPFLALSH